MVDVQIEAVRALQLTVNDAAEPASQRSREVRRFCKIYQASAPVRDRERTDRSLWTTIDTEYLLAISTDMARLSNYLVERVVAAS